MGGGFTSECFLMDILRAFRLALAPRELSFSRLGVLLNAQEGQRAVDMSAIILTSGCWRLGKRDINHIINPIMPTKAAATFLQSPSCCLCNRLTDLWHASVSASTGFQRTTDLPNPTTPELSFS